MRVRSTLTNAEGVYAVSMDQGSEDVLVTYDSMKTSAEKLAQIVREKGYTVKRVKVLD